MTCWVRGGLARTVFRWLLHRRVPSDLNSVPRASRGPVNHSASENPIVTNVRPSMSVPRLLLVAVATLGAVVTLVPSGSAQPAGAQREAGLEATMKKANRAWKALGKQIGDPAQNASSLELVQTIETNLVAAKVMVPDKAGSVPDAKRQAFVNGYRLEMIKAIEAVFEVERQLLAGDNAKAKAALAKVKAIQKEGHDLYQEGGHEGDEDEK